MHRAMVSVLSQPTNPGLRDCLDSSERAAECSAQQKISRIKSDNLLGVEKICSGRKAATAN